MRPGFGHQWGMQEGTMQVEAARQKILGKT